MYFYRLRFIMQWCFALLFPLSLSACDSINEGGGKGDDVVRVGDRLPTFSVTLSTGEPFPSDSLRGKAALLVFFNTDCSDCRRDLPLIDSLYREYGERYRFLAIGRAQDHSEAASFWQTEGMVLPYAPESDRTVYHLFARIGIPRVYVVNAEGVITAAFREKVTRKQLERALK